MPFEIILLKMTYIQQASRAFHADHGPECLIAFEAY